MKKNKILKRILLFAIVIAVAVIGVIVSCHLSVVRKASGRTYDSVDSIPYNRVGLLLATSPITPGGARNFYFDNRIKAAEELLKAGKVDFIIASGGDYTKDHKYGCDEPAAIRDSLVARGIPEERIILDYEGTRTMNSIVKAKEVYGLDSITLISQKYHNERAIYLADKYGLHAIGYNAKPSHIRRNRIKNTIREYFARPKMFIDLTFGKRADIKADSITIPELYDLYYDALGLPKYLNSVKGHKEEQSIVGNFTGNGLDTIFISDKPLMKLTASEKKQYGFGYIADGNAEEDWIWYAVSNNPEIPPVELFCPNGLVFEGDVDGDGKDEWGYLYEWMTSQWRQYRIYNYDSKTKTWRHLYYHVYDPDSYTENLLSTPEYVRSSGVDLVEKGPKPGLIKINWGAYDGIIHDTIVEPTYTPISKNAW